MRSRRPTRSTIALSSGTDKQRRARKCPTNDWILYPSMRAKSKVVNSFTSRNFPRAIRSNCSGWFALPETRNGSSPTIFLKLPPPQSASRQRYAGRSSSFIANGNKPPEFNVANAENKEPNAITSRPHCWLGTIFIRQQCWPKQRSTPSNRDYWMTTSANSSGILLSQSLLCKSYYFSSIVIIRKHHVW